MKPALGERRIGSDMIGAEPAAAPQHQDALRGPLRAVLALGLALGTLLVPFQSSTPVANAQTQTGPTITVTKVADADEAIRLTNATSYGLAGSVFAKKRGMEIARHAVGVEQIGEFNVTLAERFLGKPGASLAEAQAKAAKQVTSALVRVQREVIGV